MNLSSVIFMYINLGLEHIITGYDHILFLLALIVITRSFKKAVKIVTAFTVAHSITLFLVAMELVPVYPKWIEAGIAMTICYVAVENFFAPNAKWRWGLTFVFGFIHGFGFAASIADIGFDKKNLVASLLSFNVGIELGQFAIMGCIFPVLLKMRTNTRYYSVLLKGVSACIFLIGAYWFIERMI
jgi:hydrogenase/urease accessory protein HupE